MNDGSGAAPAPISSVLINGIGCVDVKAMEHISLDLVPQTFDVDHGKVYLFRVINVGLKVL